MAGSFIAKVRRALRKDPRYLARRAWMEVSAEAERLFGPRRARALRADNLARRAGLADVNALWTRLQARPYPHSRPDGADFRALFPAATEAVLERARQALVPEVDLLGSGPVALATPVDWMVDIKTGTRWAPRFHRDIEYNDFDRPSDVKLPWELSRLQWALPLGQAWRLTGEARYADRARALLEDWLAANPYGASVNWACTMEPALRILTWTWLFHACADAPSWSDAAFRARFIEGLYLHADFVARNLERADINGNHYTADAAGLVYAGLFFGEVGDAPQWWRTGWSILQTELPRQVFPDGVDFEASVPYHRLVLELFAYPALYAMHSGHPVPPAYRERLLQMARFIAAYSRDDGSVPLWGDADDGRALAFGVQALNDHRYLVGTLALAFDDAALLARFSGPRDEVAWICGMAAARRLPERAMAPEAPSQDFPQGGFYVLRAARHHVFVDCGPLGLAGRGGHGHNDLLSFEAVLHGVPLVSDCGAFLYTASMVERNRFRSTALHNTPQVDDEEINRFVRPDYLWSLHDDARHELLRFEHDAAHSVFEGRHDGYRRLAAPVVVVRRIELDHATGRLTIEDRFEGSGSHRWRTPWHLAPGVQVTASPGGGRVELAAQGRRFALRWSAADAWHCRVEAGRVSPAYGRVLPVSVLVFEREGEALPLQVVVEAMS